MIRVITSRGIRWAEHMELMGKIKRHTVYCWETFKKSDHLENLGVNGRIKQKLTLNNWNGGTRTGLIWLTRGTHGNETLGSIQYGIILVSVSNYQLPKKDPTP
jgi:hypothetical protein